MSLLLTQTRSIMGGATGGGGGGTGPPLSKVSGVQYPAILGEAEALSVVVYT